jgi:hypothetical protein
MNDIQLSTEECCEFLIRRLETVGEEFFEKNYIQNNEIKASVFAVVGPNSEVVTGMLREWLHQNGFNRNP